MPNRHKAKITRAPRTPEYLAWANNVKTLLRGLPRWQAYHERYYCPEITSDDGVTYHLLDVEALHEWLLSIAAPRQAQVMEAWMVGTMEREIAASLGLAPGSPTYMYLDDLLRKAYRVRLGQAA